MRKITIEQYVKLVNYFIDNSVNPRNSEDDRVMWSYAAYRLKEYYEYQDSKHAQYDWDQLHQPMLIKATTHLHWFLDKE